MIVIIKEIDENLDKSMTNDRWKTVSETKEEEWVERVIGRNWLHVLCSPYRQKYVECARKLLLEPKNKDHQNTYKI